jgi:hypothetical protein
VKSIELKRFKPRSSVASIDPLSTFHTLTFVPEPAATRLPSGESDTALLDESRPANVLINFLVLTSQRAAPLPVATAINLPSGVNEGLEDPAIIEGTISIGRWLTL